MRIDRLKLSLALKERDMTQTELARRAEVSRTAVNQICCGRSCRQETAAKIAKALEVKVEELT